jgi:aminocarboxymuconate-semialdehyde decarboxylase
MKRLWFDTCVFRTDLTEMLLAMVGTERLMLGSDFPFDMGDDDPVGLVNRVRLSEADRQRQPSVQDNSTHRALMCRARD